MILQFNAKVRDMLSIDAVMDNGDVIQIQEDGYIPDCAIGSGKYLTFSIDNATGQIIGWKPINLEDWLEDV